jgi:hypothetical protein
MSMHKPDKIRLIFKLYPKFNSKNTFIQRQTKPNIIYWTLSFNGLLIMLNKNATRNFSRVPYEYFIIDDFLDDDTYTQMRKDFYSIADRITSWSKEYGVAFVSNEVLDKPILIYGGTHATDSYSDMYSKFGNKKVFKTFLEQLLKKDFVQQIISPISIKRIKLWRPTEKINLFNKIFYNNLTLSIKISRSFPGSGIALHPDNYPKVISMLLYFGWSDGKERKMQGTQIYKKDINFPTPMHHCYFQHEKFTLHQDVFPLENRLMGFVAGEQSWHGVDPNSCKETADVTRDVLQINLVKHTLYGGLAKLLADSKNCLSNFLKK